MRNVLMALALVGTGLQLLGGTRSEVRWQFPLRSCHEGIPFGNARSGFLVWGGGSALNVTIGRDDTWDHRGGFDWNADQSYANITAALHSNDMERVKRLFRRGEIRPGEPKNPQIVPVGHCSFALPMGTAIEDGVLDTETGIARLSLLRGGRKTEGEIVLALDRASGVMAVCWPEGVSPTGVAVPAWDHDAVARELKAIGFEAPMRFTLPDGAGFVQPLPADPAIGAGFVTRSGTSYLVATRGSDRMKAQSAVESDLAMAARLGFDAFRKGSESFWRGWWRSSPEIEVPDAVIREIHDLGMYKYGCMADEKGVPVTLQGPFIEEYRIPPWHGDYHFNINVQLCYWPAFRGNHLDSLLPLFRMIRSWWPVLRDNARKFAGVENGFMLPHSVDDRGRLIGGYWAGTMDFACTPWVCQMMYRYVRMSGDIAFLRSDAYPFMKGTMNVLMKLMEDRDGVLSYPASTSPEFDSHNGWGRDASFQLAATHRLARNLIEAADVLGEASDPRWQDVLNRLPIASFHGGKNGGEVELWRGLPLPESHRHHSHLAGYVPFDVWDFEGDESMRETTRRTVVRWTCRGMGNWSGWSFGWAAMLHVCFGQADAADTVLHVWERMFTNGGHGSRHDVYYPGLSVMRRGAHAAEFDVAGDAPGEEIMQIDGAMAATAAVQEMFVSEHGGVLYVMRGAPGRWRDCSFRNVLSDDGVLVSGRRQGGRIERIELVAKRPAAMRLASPWKSGEVLAVELAAGERKVIMSEDRK